MIINEYVVLDNSIRIIVRSDTYDHRLVHVNWLFREAKEDFPSISEKDVTITHYAGSKYKGTFGIEFEVPLNTFIPADYAKVHSLEKSL